VVKRLSGNGQKVVRRCLNDCQAVVEGLEVGRFCFFAPSACFLFAIFSRCCFFAAGIERISPEWQSGMEAGGGGATLGATENAIADTALA